MSKFEVYMINTIKRWSDMEQREKNEDIKFMEKNVLAELMSALYAFNTYITNIQLEDEDQDEDPDQELDEGNDMINNRKTA